MREPDALQSFFLLVDAFAEARSIGDARISTFVFNDGSRIKELREGGEVGYRRLLRAIQWFSDNWPENARWPSGVKRPVKTRVEVPA